MSIALSEEALVSLTEAIQLLPGRPHFSTLWRWYRRGLRGVRLETVVVGGRRFTSREAVARFIGRTTAAHDAVPLPSVNTGAANLPTLSKGATSS